jgi:serine/threonine protein phosphatase PrpC
MKRTFAFGAATAQGSWPVQEDGFFADPGSATFAIADGFGGRGAGDLAAKQALQESRAAGTADRSPREGGILSHSQAAHRELFGEINKKLLQWNEKRGTAKGGCSLILATVVSERELTITSCGACSAFLLRAGNWISLLSAQSPPRAAETDPLFPAQALGLGRELNPESRSFQWAPADVLFLFSGGLAWERSGFQSELAAQQAIRMPGTDLAALATFATQAASPWNQTALAVEALV